VEVLTESPQIARQVRPRIEVESAGKRKTTLFNAFSPDKEDFVEGKRPLLM
jgi:hypothetical protein